MAQSSKTGWSSTPPAHTKTSSSVAPDQDDLATRLSSVTLSLPQIPTAAPTPHVLLAHLRLLHAFDALKTAIGYRDGLWSIHDSRARQAKADGTWPYEEQSLAKVREKRWAVYVARAVDRYGAWWESFMSKRLLESDMLKPGKGTVTSAKAKYEGFVHVEAEVDAWVWREEMLPPLDVLLVWHAHLLNPRFYLEDCLRYGYDSLWAAGLPWPIINAAIDNQFDYSVSEAAKSKWVEQTGLAWLNEDDPDVKVLNCPSCSERQVIPWTTCGQDEDSKGERLPGLVGQGYGDGQLKHACSKCGLIITHDALRLSKFRTDVKSLVSKNYALPGTILDLKSGLPKKVAKDDDRLFPSRLARHSLLARVIELLQPGSSEKPSMALVRDMIEKVTGRFADSKELNHVEGVEMSKGPVQLDLDARRQTRSMMARYWANSSPFGLDLVGAVLRQDMFTEKMIKLKWLLSPVVEQTMSRALLKYGRFFEIIASYPKELACPTLDIDLAWHTHQLSPKAYLTYAVSKTRSLTDHNDRVDEEKLGSSFEWTSKTYQERYGEVYAECTCWYCETTRVMHISAGKLLSSRQEKFLENWHSSGAAQSSPQPPQVPSAHISSHPAVHTEETTAQRAHTRPLRHEFRNRLEDAHAKARIRATNSLKKASADGTSKGRMGPRGHDVVEYWGTEVHAAAPYASGIAAASTPAMYHAAPGSVNTGPGAEGSCASGTCGGSAGCGSETVGMCTAGCVGIGASGCAGGAGG